MSSNRRRPARSDAGIALLLAVWLLAVLAVLAGEFMFSGRVKARAERNRLDALAGYGLALAGYNDALAALGPKLERLSRDGEDRLVLHYRAVAEGVLARREKVPLGDGAFSWSITDEDGRVDLNAAGRPVLVPLLAACGLGPGADRDTVVASILDWRDANREHRLNGAEEDHYRALDPPYSCKDGPFDVPEELLLVRGVTPELFGGGKDGAAERPGLRDLVTVCPADFNPGSAPKAVLDALGRPRPVRSTPPSRFYALSVTGHPGAGAPPRSLRAVLERESNGDSVEFRLVYWNDDVVSDAGGQSR